MLLTNTDKIVHAISQQQSDLRRVWLSSQVLEVHTGLSRSTINRTLRKHLNEETVFSVRKNKGIRVFCLQTVSPGVWGDRELTFVAPEASYLLDR